MRGLSALKLWCRTVLDLFTLGYFGILGASNTKGDGTYIPSGGNQTLCARNLIPSVDDFPIKTSFYFGDFPASHVC